MKYITDIGICSDIVESINVYFNKKHTNISYTIDHGSYGITMKFNTSSVNYGILESIYKILNDHGYKYKMKPLKNFMVLKKDKEQRIKIAIYANGDFSQSVDMYLIPEYRMKVENFNET